MKMICYFSHRHIRLLQEIADFLIKRRDGRTPGEVRLRIAAQTDDDTLSAKADYTLVNILESDLEPAVAELHRIFSHEAHEH